MTLEQWKALKPGDVVIDRAFPIDDKVGQRRKIFRVTRREVYASGNPCRVTNLEVSSLKQTSRRTILTASDRIGPSRFDLVEPDPKTNKES